MTMTSIPRTHTRIGMVGAIALLGVALATPARAADFLYDFNSRTVGPLIAQDGWYSPRSYWSNPPIVSGTSPSGTSNMVQGTTGSFAAARALPTGTFFSGSEMAAVLQYDVQATRYYSANQVWLGGNGTQQVLGDDWYGAQVKLGPSLGFYNSTAGVYTFRLGVKNTSSDAGNDGGWIPLDYVSTVPLGHWVTLKLVIDFTANGGAGSGNVFYKDLTAGDTSFTPVVSLQHVNLGLANGGLAAGYTPANWNQIGFDLSPVDTYSSSIDNLVVSSGVQTPVEDVGLTLLAANNTATVGGLSSMESNSPVTSRLNASGKRQVFWAYITPATGTYANGAVTDAELVVRHVSDTGTIAEYKLKNPNNTSQTYRITNDPYHVAPSIGIDQSGYIHVAANMHYHGWQYWKSAQPYSVAGGFNWKGCTLTATPEPNVTGAPSATSPPGYMISYPYFFNDLDGRLYVTYRQRLTSSWGAGCTGGALAQYVASTGTWVAIGGTSYTLPGGMQPWNGVKAPTLMHHTDGCTDIPAYQAYNISVAFDNWGTMHLAATLWSAAGGIQANGPTQVVYLRGDPGTVEANGSRNWVFKRPNNAAIPNADLPAQLGTNELWTVYTRPAANKLQFTAKCGVGYQPGSPATPRPIVRYNEMVSPNTWWTGTSRHFYPINNNYGWNLMDHVSPQAGYFFGQGNAGGGFLTTFTAYSNGSTVYRTNDNGATGIAYSLDTGSSGMKIDFSYALAYRNAVTGQKILIEHIEPGLNATVASSSATATLEVIDFQ